MPRLWLLGFALLPGCSNAPLAGTLDCLFPSRFRPSPVVPDLGREQDRDLESIRPLDRVPVPVLDDPRTPLDAPRPIRDGGTRFGDPRLGEPLSRELNPRTRRTAPEPRDGNDSDLPLLPPPGGNGGLNDPLPPPPGAR